MEVQLAFKISFKGIRPIVNAKALACTNALQTHSKSSEPHEASSRTALSEIRGLFLNHLHCMTFNWVYIASAFVLEKLCHLLPLAD